jgi:hypothetical protein
MYQIIGVDIPGRYFIDINNKRLILVDLPCPFKVVSVKNNDLILDFENFNSNIIDIKSDVNLLDNDNFEIILDIEEHNKISYSNWKK